MKRILSVFFLLSLVFGAIPVFAYGAAPHGGVVKKAVQKKVVQKKVIQKIVKKKIIPVKKGGSSIGKPQVPAAPGATSSTPSPVVPPPATSPAPAAVAPAVLSVNIQNFAFTPSVLNVKVGDTVTWTNLDAATHTVEADAGAFKSGNLSTGLTFRHTFTAAGTFAYHCGPHPSMTGSVVVSQ